MQFSKNRWFAKVLKSGRESGENWSRGRLFWNPGKFWIAEMFSALRVFRAGTRLTVHRPLDILKLLRCPMGVRPQRLSVHLDQKNQVLLKISL